MFTFVQQDQFDPTFVSIVYNDGDFFLSWNPRDAKIILEQYSNIVQNLSSGSPATIYDVIREVDDGKAIEVYDGKIGFFDSESSTRMNSTPERLQSLLSALSAWYNHALTLN